MGKTLLAKAVAGEAGVNFFSISASQFVEIYVGVGASRVRALYQEAKENVCHIFLLCHCTLTYFFSIFFFVLGQSIRVWFLQQISAINFLLSISI